MQQEIVKFIFSQALLKCIERIDEIAVTHSFKCPHGNESFMFKGKVYAKQQARIAYRKPVTLLTKDQHPAMEEYLVMEKELNNEMALVHSFLSCAISQSHCKQDLLKLLPECIHSALSRFHWEGEPKITDRGAEKFKERAADTIQTIKRRLIVNLIS